MIPQTIGIKHDVGRVALVQCVRNDPLTALRIRNQCFLLLLIREGSAAFSVGQRSFPAVGPCVVCFDERADVTVTEQAGLCCDAVYFHPKFLNVNMTFDRVHSQDYAQLAVAHDLFLMKPFMDEDRFVFPLLEDAAQRMQALFDGLESELREQPDWYWSCRSRSFFMEMMLLLERCYGIAEQQQANAGAIRNPYLKKAVLYIEGHYHQPLLLEDITKAASLNHASLTQLFKRELGMTAVDYLWCWRLNVAKKHLEFTNLPVKDIALRCGFKTVQHFSRKFEQVNGVAPTVFRERALQRRKAVF